MRSMLAHVLLILSFFSVVLSSSPAFADEQSDRLNELNRQIEEYERRLSELAGQKKTLAATISVLNTSISLTQSRIAKTEQELVILTREIEALTDKIDRLNASLDELSTVLVYRIRETYTQSSIQPIYLFLTSRGFTDFVNRYKYVRTVQNHDKELLLAMERSRANYDLQKSLKEEKQAEVETLKNSLKRQKDSLARQQQEKQQLLELTKNDEKQFQDLLSKARSELAAIQSIIAGKGDETRVGDVSEGNKIASIIPNASPCSTGSHLHFEVAATGSHQNPENYLRSASLSYDYDTSTVPETVSPRGNWRWPLNEPITVTQIYGTTFWTKFLPYDFHTGIDMKRNGEPAAPVFAVAAGTLYRGSVACGGGTLRYVKVDHGSGQTTYYLHVNYI